jgi:small subunit ribosomal protein S7
MNLPKRILGPKREPNELNYGKELSILSGPSANICWEANQMPRKKTKSLIRDIQPDRIYQNVQVQRLINRVMQNGKKQLAERLVYGGMEKAARKLKVDNPLDVFEQAMKNVRPHLETRSRRVGGANYQIPFEVKGQRQQHLTTMWFVAACRARKGMSMQDRIGAELVDAYNSQGAAVKKREDAHKMAEANRAFAHFARN